MAVFLELALRALCPLEPFEEVGELIPFEMVPANLEPALLGERFW